MNLIGDPKYVGPGVWFITHTKGKEATNASRIDEFMSFIYMLCEKFSCKNCRKHMTSYVNSHPMEDLKNLENKDGVKIGMFKWSWLFHNAVNTRLNKPYVDWETAWEMYDAESACSKNCDEAKDDHTDHTGHDHTDTKTGTSDEVIEDLPRDPIDRKSKLVQGYFMSVGIPTTLQKNNIAIPENTITYRSVKT